MSFAWQARDVSTTGLPFEAPPGAKKGV